MNPINGNIDIPSLGFQSAYSTKKIKVKQEKDKMIMPV
jgi:hypothetical protein